MCLSSVIIYATTIPHILIHSTNKEVSGLINLLSAKAYSICPPLYPEYI